MVKKKDMAIGAFVSIVISRFLQGEYVFSLEYLKWYETVAVLELYL